MPYKSATIKLKKSQDRRRKLTDEQKTEIRQLYFTVHNNEHAYSQRDLAKLYGVSRRLIVFTLYPERLKKHNWAKYYDKTKHRDYMKVHRHYKQGLYLKGELEGGGKNG